MALTKVKGSGLATGAATDSLVGIDDNATSTAITIDASENVGIGVVPESWYSQFKALQLGEGGSIWGRTGGGVYPAQVYVAANTYYNTSGSERYITTNAASQYSQTVGTHSFQVAPSGTAGAAITWTNAMTIDNGGIITTPNQPAFSVYASSQTYLVNTDVAVDLVNEEFDIGNNFASTKFTAPVAGSYLFTGAIQYSGNGTAHINFIKNGSFVNNGWLDYGDTKAASQTRILYLNANDYVQLKLYHSIAGTVNAERTRMTGYLIG